MQPLSLGTQSKPLKGRKRFHSDFQDAKRRCADTWVVEGLRIDDLRLGEDEGSILYDVVHASTNTHLMTLNTIVSDTSDYPDRHAFFCCVISEGEVASGMLSIVEAIPEEGHCSIEVLLQKLLTSCAKQLSAVADDAVDAFADGGPSSGYNTEDNESYGDTEEYHDDDDYYGVISEGFRSNIDTAVLRRDFNEIVACDYRPGLVRIGLDELVLSVSQPTFKLAETIPPQALIAWDRRLLSSVKYLTLVISGIRGVYPVLLADGTLNPRLSGLTFRLGLTTGYKPDRALVLQLARSFASDEIVKEEKQPESVHSNESDDDGSNEGSINIREEEHEEEEHEEEEEHAESFSFSLTSSLEALMNDQFLTLLQTRLRYGCGWAAAEALLSEVNLSQSKIEDVFQNHVVELQQADLEETQLSYTNRLPQDPLEAPDREEHLNLPLCAFSYALRRLTLCSRFCLVCYEKLKTDYQALKPYVCDKKLCIYQYYNLNLGPSLEYEICTKPETVDLLVSLAYSAASTDSLHGFPDYMEMRIPVIESPGSFVDFDSIAFTEKNRVIMRLLDMLPSVMQMKKQLNRTYAAGAKKLLLKHVYPDIPTAAWQLLRWCVASCTAQLEELSLPEDRVIGVGPEWRQFRFTAGAPDAEAKFQAAQAEAQKQDANALTYPSLYAFHGSATGNWHSIIRHGLWYKEVVHGRAYGDGVYFAKDGSVSMSSYSRASGMVWPKSAINVSSCVAVAEIVNLPQQFRSSSPYFVVSQTDWILCRYLLVQGTNKANDAAVMLQTSQTPNVPIMKLDPRHPVTLASKLVKFPQPTYSLYKLLAIRQEEFLQGDYDDEDLKIFVDEVQEQSHIVEPMRCTNDWDHDSSWVEACVQHMLPAPDDATPVATASLQRELARMMKEQEKATSLTDLGWYMPPDFIDDNLFQWIIELHSFDPALPIAQDLKARNVNSIVFEILFPPTYPHSPPFFRILKPRFLPFSHGGGGHVTGGGSMCMDLLTADGWLPSYSISAILLQIKLAISNLDPRPARLAGNWDTPYSMYEAIEGYKRAAQAHGWRIPLEIDRMARGSTL